MLCGTKLASNKMPGVECSVDQTTLVINALVLLLSILDNRRAYQLV